MRWMISLIYVVQVYLMMAIMGIVFSPWALFSRKGARFACKTYCAWALGTARLMIGLRTEVRGTVPTDEVMIAAKHQSFLDIMIIFYAVPEAKFIMKRELLWAPFIGQYAYRLGCVPVNRGKRGAAIAKMLNDVSKGLAYPGQLIIYPQGTRVAPGVKAPYKAGTAALYEQLGQPCVPAATNAGVFWPRKGIWRKPGLAVVEFLPEVAQGQPKQAFLDALERDIETRSNALMAEAGFAVDGHN